MSIRSVRLIVSFQFSSSLLIFCLLVVSIIESEVYKSLTIIVGSSIYLYNFVSFPHVYQGSLVRCICVYNCYSFLVNQPFYHYEMS